MIIKKTALVFAFYSLFSVGAMANMPFDRTADEIALHCPVYLEKFSSQLAALTASEKAATYQSVIRPLDSYLVEFGSHLLLDNLTKNVHVDEAVRNASTECTLKGFAIFNGLAMNRPLYERIAKVEVIGLDKAQAYTVNFHMQQFEASGIAKDKATREKIKNLKDDISNINNIFGQNITADVRSMSIAKNRLEGVPADYLASHPADDKGMVTISTSYADIGPIFKYVHDRSLRKEVLEMSWSRGYPQNKAVLEQLIAKRYELAKLLDHDNYAQLDMLGTMVLTPKNVETFTSTLSAAIKGPVEKEKAMLLARIQQIEADIKAVE